jgi:hypothetical protein
MLHIGRSTPDWTGLDWTGLDWTGLGLTWAGGGGRIVEGWCKMQRVYGRVEKGRVNNDNGQVEQGQQMANVYYEFWVCGAILDDKGRLR